MLQLTDIQAALTAETDTETATITLLNQISDMLKAALASGDQGQIQNIINQLDANKAALATAIAADTPQDNPPPPPPPGS